MVNRWGAAMSAFKLLLHRLTFSKEITLDGVRVCTDPQLVPKTVRRSIIKGSHEQYERQLVKRYLGPTDRVLEIGAASGLVTLVCARQCGAASVFAYEANPVMEPIIRKNFALNGWQPNLIMKAVTVDGGDVQFFASDNVYSSSVIDRSKTVAGRLIKVPSDPFQHVLARVRPTTVVMDVEGAEIALLSSAALDGVERIIVEVHPHITGADAVQAMTSSLAGQGLNVRETVHKTLFLTRD